MRLSRTILLLIIVNLSCLDGFSQNRNQGTITINDTVSFDGEKEKPPLWPSEVRTKRRQELKNYQHNNQ